MFSRKHIVNLLLGALILGSLAAYSARNHTQQHSHSSLAVKGKPLPWGHTVKGKFLRNFDISISAPQGIAGADTTKLIAEIQPLQTRLSNLSYVWIIPAGTTLESGELSGTQPAPAPGQKITLELSVKNFGADIKPETIALQVYEEQDGTRVGGASAISSKTGPSEEFAIGLQKAQTPGRSDQQAKPRIHE